MLATGKVMLPNSHLTDRRSPGLLLQPWQVDDAHLHAWLWLFRLEAKHCVLDVATPEAAAHWWLSSLRLPVPQGALCFAALCRRARRPG